jgi:hypothetical protein
MTYEVNSLRDSQVYVRDVPQFQRFRGFGNTDLT